MRLRQKSFPPFTFHKTLNYQTYSLPANPTSFFPQITNFIIFPQIRSHYTFTTIIPQSLCEALQADHKLFTKVSTFK